MSQERRLRSVSRSFLLLLTSLLPAASLLSAQDPALQSASSAQPAVVPQTVRFAGAAQNRAGDMVEAVFRIYSQREGGEPLWSEEQRVTIAPDGRYSVLLGAASEHGLPQAVFAAGQARWLAVSIERGEEQPRTLLASVAYAMKAADAETLAGRQAADFVTQEQLSAAARVLAAQATALAMPEAATTGAGTSNYVPLWTGSAALGDSILYQAGTTKVGIATKTPATTLDVNGTATLRGTVSLPPAALATSKAAVDSPMLELGASSFSSGAKAAVAQDFAWRAVATGNDTSTASADLQLLFGSGASSPAATGLEISPKGILSFAKGQTFPAPASGPGSGTITGVTAGTALTGGGTGGPITLDVDTTKVVTTVNAGTGLTGGGTGGVQTLMVDATKVPLLGAANTFAGSNTFSSPVTFAASQTFAGAVIASGNNTYTGNQTINGLETVAGSSTVSVATVTDSATSGLALTAKGFNGVSATGNATNGTGITATGNVGVNGSGGTYGVLGTTNGSSDTDAGVYGSGVNYGVYGTSNATPVFLGTPVAGVYGVQTKGGSGVYGSGNVGVTGAGGSFGVTGAGTVGVEGNGGCCSGGIGSGGVGVQGFGAFGVQGSTYAEEYSDYGWGVSGYVEDSSGNYSAEGTAFAGSSSAGVWGDDIGGGAGSGVLATADSNTALIAANNSGYPTMEVYNYTAATHNPVFETLSPNTYSDARSCVIDTSANLTCTGVLTAVVPVQDGAVRSMYAVQSPENWFEDFGSATLQDGSAHVSLEAIFGETVNSGVEYHVFLTPKGECEGLYVANEGVEGFDVRELRHGTSSVAFDYRIVAKRKGYETMRMEDLTAQAEARKTRMEDRARRMAEAAAHPPATPARRLDRPRPPSRPSSTPQMLGPHAGPAAMSGHLAEEAP
jgi:hypothetical protein